MLLRRDNFDLARIKLLKQIKYRNKERSPKGANEKTRLIDEVGAANSGQIVFSDTSERW